MKTLYRIIAQFRTKEPQVAWADKGDADARVHATETRSSCKMLKGTWHHKVVIETFDVDASNDYWHDLWNADGIEELQYRVRTIKE